MKAILVGLMCLVLVTSVMASPFIVADPQTATKYRMRLSADNGVTWGVWIEGDPVNGALRFDVEGIPKGDYKGEAQAGGNVSLTDSTSGATSVVWMWSASAPFVLNLRAGQVVVNLRVVE